MPVNAGSTPYLKTAPVVLAVPFARGGNKLIPPTIVVPSIPNFNLFLNTAAAFSFGSCNSFLNLLSFVLSKARSKLLPSSSPNILPILFCP